MNLSRKQREIASRHALFLDIGKRILDEEGFHLLTMERIAELAEYSKGTVYQHFTCKEEILIQLCIDAMTRLLAIFERAANFEGSNRDRLIATFYGQQLWTRIGGNQSDMQQHLLMHGVRDKVTEQSLQKHDELEQALFNTVSTIVEQAITSGELKKNKHMQTCNVVFGVWSLCTGGQILRSSDLPLEDFGVIDPDMTVLRTICIMLDGLGWQPLHSEAYLKKLIKRLNSEVLADAYEQAMRDAEKT